MPDLQPSAYLTTRDCIKTNGVPDNRGLHLKNLHGSTVRSTVNPWQDLRGLDPLNGPAAPGLSNGWPLARSQPGGAAILIIHGAHRISSTFNFLQAPRQPKSCVNENLST